LWTFDEHRIGLIPILRKVYAPKGERPVITVQPRYEWLYLYGFVQPQSGQTHWYILPEVNTEALNLVLSDLAPTLTANNKHILLVMDQAGWHSSPQLKVPEGIEIIFQPPYSPELQPAERLWQLSDEPISNKHFTNLDALQQTLSHQCVRLMAQPQLVKAHTLFHWWPIINY
jgi:transposase